MHAKKTNYWQKASKERRAQGKGQEPNNCINRAHLPAGRQGAKSKSRRTASKSLSSLKSFEIAAWGKDQKAQNSEHRA